MRTLVVVVVALIATIAAVPVAAQVIPTPRPESAPVGPGTITGTSIGTGLGLILGRGQDSTTRTGYALVGAGIGGFLGYSLDKREFEKPAVRSGCVTERRYVHGQMTVNTTECREVSTSPTPLGQPGSILGYTSPALAAYVSMAPQSPTWDTYQPVGILSDNLSPSYSTSREVYGIGK